MIRPTKVTGEDICEEIRSHHIKYTFLYGGGVLFLTVAFVLIMNACRDNGVNKLPAILIFVAAEALFLFLFCSYFAVLLDLRRTALLRYYGPPELLAQAIRETAEDVIYRDQSVTVTTKYLLHKEIVISKWVSGYVPLEDMLLVFGQSDPNDQLGPSLWCVDRYGVEHKFHCPNPWMVCERMMPLINKKARYSQDHNEIMRLLKEAGIYAKILKGKHPRNKSLLTELEALDIAEPVLRKVLHLLAERRYESLDRTVITKPINPEKFGAALEYHFASNGFSCIDKFDAPFWMPSNPFHRQYAACVYEDGRGFCIDYTLTSDAIPNGITLQMEFLKEESGYQPYLRDCQFV